MWTSGGRILSLVPLRPDAVERPHPERFSPDHRGYDQCVAAHAAAVRTGQAGYLDPITGLFVITATTHLDRGACCDRGCRHCPYLGATDD